VILSQERVKLAETLYTVGKDTSQATNPLVQDSRKLVPSVTHIFNSRELFFVYLQAYQSEVSTAQSLTAYVGLYRAGTKVYESAPTEFAPVRNSSMKTTPVKFALALDQLETGRYECQVTVLDRATGRLFFWREPILFTK
jgi:hypothetical protein